MLYTLYSVDKSQNRIIASFRSHYPWSIITEVIYYFAFVYNTSYNVKVNDIIIELIFITFSSNILVYLYFNMALFILYKHLTQTSQ